MKKPVIIVAKKVKMPYMNFYLISEGKKIDLFTMSYQKNVYDFFRNGKSINQLYKYKRWEKRDLLSRLIKVKIPYELKKIKKGGVLIDI